MILLAFLALLALPVIIYKIRLLLANVRVVKADVDSGYATNLNHAIDGINLSIKNHILIFYGVYVISISLFALLKPNAEAFYAMQILNILIIFCFIWLLIQPFPESFSVIATFAFEEDGKVVSTKVGTRKRRKLVYTKMYEDLLLRKFSQGFDRSRGVLYEGFFRFSQKDDIISYLNLKVKEYAYARQYLNITSPHINSLQKNKLIFFAIFIVTLLANYIVLYSGIASHILSFNDKAVGLVKPLYFLLTTFATVGYGDIAPSSHVDTIITVSLLFQLLLFIFVLVNIINDQSASASVKFNRPFLEMHDFLLSEANTLIHQVETGMFEKDIDKAIDKFGHIPLIAIYLQQYKARLNRSDTYSI